MILIASLLVLGALAETPQASQVPVPTPSPPSRQYTLGPQDQIKLTVLEDSDMNNLYRLDADGFITLPYLNRVPAAGLTPSELQDRIHALLKDGRFIQNASVRVEVDQTRSQSVLVGGEVRAPGEIPISGSMTLLKALAMA